MHLARLSQALGLRVVSYHLHRTQTNIYDKQTGPFNARELQSLDIHIIPLFVVAQLSICITKSKAQFPYLLTHKILIAYGYGKLNTSSKDGTRIT